MSLVLSLAAARPFPGSVGPSHIETYISSNQSLNLGSVTAGGFQLGFSYSGQCVFVASVRLYYRRCPGFVAELARFAGAVAGTEDPQGGFCVEGAPTPIAMRTASGERCAAGVCVSRATREGVTRVQVRMGKAS